MARGNKAIRNNGVALIGHDVAGQYAFGGSDRLPLKLGSPALWSLLFCFSGLLSIAAQGDESYPPAVRQAYPNNLYWGDTHVHTYLSSDAYPMGTRITLDEAYRFASGEKIHSEGQYAQLSVPLDFMMVADHAENMGVFPKIAAGDPALLKTDAGKRVLAALKQLPSVGEALASPTEAKYQTASDKLLGGKALKNTRFSLSEDFKKHTWHDVIDSAERHNNPGHFTTFAGYEYSSANLHRNVLFVGGPNHTQQIIPFSAFDSDNPEDLWSFLEKYRKTTGSDVISIPHNSNLSRGNMFKTTTFNGGKITTQYAKTRASIEPVMEVTQIKGDSEAHPSISPEDDFSGHEKAWWDMMMKFSKGKDGIQETDQAKQSFARSALKSGLALEAQLGANPFKFGMLGSTDSHTGLATATESNFWGKMAMDRPNPYRANRSAIYSAAGYAAVWASENTREAIFAAFKRREVYATTGPRIRLRFFGGWDFQPDDILQPDIAEVGYRKGVPMGGDLLPSEGAAPTFLVSAVKDPLGANLDRIQIVKGWLDTAGQLHEKIYDVDWSGDRALGEDGSLPVVGSSVDVDSATYLNSIGSHTLAALWSDPSFKPSEPAFYYLRVIQIPTPRWTTYDASFYQLPVAPKPQVIQERAYSSPIWYTP